MMSERPVVANVMHTGTRYTLQLLRGWGINPEHYHINHDVLWHSEFIERQAIVTVRNPYHVFLTWWKDSEELIHQRDFGNAFLRSYGRLDEWINLRNVREAHTIYFYVDKQEPRALAEALGATYREVPITSSAHFITAKFVLPNYAAFPDEVRAVAERWGYSPEVPITEADKGLLEQVMP